MRDDLGLGTCPPMANKIDQGEDGQLTATDTQPRQPAARQHNPQIAAEFWFRRGLKSAKLGAERALSSARKIQTFSGDQAKQASEDIEAIRQLLNDIQQALAGHGASA